MLTNISLQEALEILHNESTQNESVHVPLMDSLGSILAEEILSDMNIPPFDTSLRDGFAVKSQDTVGATSNTSVILELIDFVPAGHISTKEIKNGQAIRIMTGAKIPKGADAVIPLEDTESIDEKVEIFCACSKNSFITPTGEDVKRGAVVINKGSIIDPSEIGTLSYLGRNSVQVYRKPRVAILSTGDELVDLEQPVLEGKIRNSNSYSIAAQVKKLGADPRILGVCSDNIELIKEKITPALSWADIIITTGGAAGGDCDLIKEAFQEAGAEMLFWRIRMKPGAAVAVAKFENKLLFGLSGNPSAAYTSFEHLVRPIILKKMGRQNCDFMEVESILENDITKISNQDIFTRANTYYKDGNYHTTIPNRRSSGVLNSLGGTNSLIFIPSKSVPYKSGEKIKVKLINHLEV